MTWPAASLWVLLTTAPLAHGAPVAEISGLDVVAYVDGRPVIKKWTYANAPMTKSFEIISPSPTNEAQIKQTWSGPLIRDFIPSSLRKTPSFRKSLVLTSSDFYVSSPRSSIILEHDAIIALKIDGQKILWSNGGPQVMFPFHSAQLPREYHKHAWCPWFVTSIIIGEGDPILSVFRGKNEKSSMDLRKVCKKQDRWNISYPRGQWHSPPEKKSLAEIARCSVSELFDGEAVAAKEVTFHSLNGSTLTINASSKKHYLAFAWDGKGIPSRFGGPVQLCVEGDYTDCQFFVYRVDISG